MKEMVENLTAVCKPCPMSVVEFASACGPALEDPASNTNLLCSPGSCHDAFALAKSSCKEGEVLPGVEIQEAMLAMSDACEPCPKLMMQAVAECPDSAICTDTCQSIACNIIQSCSGREFPKLNITASAVDEAVNTTASHMSTACPGFSCAAGLARGKRTSASKTHHGTEKVAASIAQTLKLYSSRIQPMAPERRSPSLLAPLVGGFSILATAILLVLRFTRRPRSGAELDLLPQELDFELE